MAPKGERPVLLFDGDCGFCRAWVARWRHVTGEAVEYAAAQEAGARFPQVPAEAFARAVQLVEPDGRVLEGAEAVFRALAYAGGMAGVWGGLYRRLPAFAAASEAVYRLVAARRALFSRLTRLLWGDDLSPPTFHLARWLFLKGLGLCYLTAFVSFAVQARGLVGARGILPAQELLDRAGAALGRGRWLELPTLFWWTGASDGLLTAVAWAGAAASLAFLAGFIPVALAALLWALYLTIYSVGGLFLGYQWDILLLEAGALVVLAAPWGLRPALASERAPPRAALWLVRWLWFRLIFLSGLVKLASKDEAWWSLDALRFHYETQPLPHALAWYAHQLPGWWQRASCGVMFFIELALPFGVFLPRRLRLLSFLGVNALMLLITLTGNYTFFNLLAVALSWPLLDDSLLLRLAPFLRPRLGGTGARPPEAAWRRSLALAFALFVVPTSMAQGLARVWDESAEWAAVRSLAVAGHTLNLVNAYGLFAVMTRPRYEIVVEGTADGKEWKAYEFKWKPGDPQRRPGWVQPHQPRLDWQMWFAALAPYQREPWYLLFLKRLLEGSPEVTVLLAKDPFPDAPPKAIRSLFYEYRFTTAAERRATGAWWKRELKGLYAPIVVLTPEGGLAAAAPPTGSR